MKLIALSQGQSATVDDEDFETLSKFKWHAWRGRGCFYAFRNMTAPNGRRTTQAMHVFLVGQPGVDHKDGDGLNNRRGNLRPATTIQNGRGFRRKSAISSSTYRGVNWQTRDQTWRARISLSSGKEIHLGNFSDEVEAAKAYDEAVVKHFSEFACVNFPPLTLS